ncbi:microcin C transport system permease protein [Desulfobotulus alkaliphilus]|uniref:Microcin C transport system permease protein n=1 Tax=Desulfobotulus alkaliphilus TaxID=622671 RepID=A0A562S721_9BACT|nr:ABC transporter permease [Desulfobotulus alkaliphilus]TWI76923.1 microcin C transport system permease protein [Desulfobotulus alkaliphilus]
MGMMVRLGPVGQRRWQRFRKNGRGYYSLWIFAFLFFLTLGAEFVANDRPLYVHYGGEHFFPVFASYPETRFGGVFETPAVYRDPFVQELIKKEGFMVWPLIPFSYETVSLGRMEAFPAPPSPENWLGTDDQGRDVLARLIYGFRVSVLFGLCLAGLGSAIGVCVGAVQGYFGGWVDLAGQRMVEIWSGLPILYLLILLSSVVTPDFWWLLGIMLLFGWMSLVGVVRAEFLRGRNLEYVRAARALGMGHGRIMYQHILPNAMVAALTFLPFQVSAAIGSLTALDFLGFGLPPGSPSLGELLAQGKANLHAPWLGIAAFTVLALLLSLLVFIGEAVRDAFDPRLEG